MDSSCAAIILSSGLSERMGEPKALLKWDHSKSFLEKIISEYTEAGCRKIVCTINAKTEALCNNLNLPSAVKFVLNQHPEWGRLYAISIAAHELLESDFCFVQNVDNPFVTAELIDNIYSGKSPDAWCSPVHNGKGGHPVLLPQMIIQKIAETKTTGITLNDILKPCRRINVEIDSDNIFRNINTPEEYAVYFKK
jgi:CTP:molybdopterin cytidylyltransferase MocA